jgi:hypothetical protein
MHWLTSMYWPVFAAAKADCPSASGTPQLPGPTAARPTTANGPASIADTARGSTNRKCCPAAASNGSRPLRRAPANRIAADGREPNAGPGPHHGMPYGLAAVHITD